MQGSKFCYFASNIDVALQFLMDSFAKSADGNSASWSLSTSIIEWLMNWRRPTIARRSPSKHYGSQAFNAIISFFIAAGDHRTFLVAPFQHQRSKGRSNTGSPLAQPLPRNKNMLKKSHSHHSIASVCQKRSIHCRLQVLIPSERGREAYGWVLG